MNYKLIPITENDYNFIYNLKKNAYMKYVDEIWGWNEEAQQGYFENFIEKYKNNTYLIKLDDKVIGFYNDEILENGDYEVGNICIIPEYQGKGIGTKILKDILEINKDKNIHIQYFKQNPVGNLYARLGFIPNGETDYHYQMIKRK
ncbi:MAG: GNAT family N-acetyltransferase [Bacilli bacterium]|nr:GNAT family N-acetyltransferase [Bacilli bacterium]